MSKISTKHIFDILPTVVLSDRKKRDIEDNEHHIYDSHNNHHVIFKREINKPSKTGDDFIDSIIPDGNYLFTPFSHFNNRLKIKLNKQAFRSFITFTFTLTTFNAIFI